MTLTPTLNWNGVSNIFAYVSDGTLSDTSKFSLSVIAVNDAPVITTIPDDSTIEETPKTIVLEGSDVDGDFLSYTAFTDTSGVEVAINSNSLLITPIKDFAGSEIIEIIVSDGLLTDTTTFIFKVKNINDKPILEVIPNYTILEDSSLSITINAFDPDGDSLAFTCIPDSSAINHTHPSSGNIFQFIPEMNWFGSSLVRVTVSDGQVADSSSFLITVESVNDPPNTFVWNNFQARDTININLTNLENEYRIEWLSSNDVEGDTLKYHIHGSTYSDNLIDVILDTSIIFTYQELLDYWPPEFQMLPRMVFKFDVWVNDGIDSVQITGDPFELFVNRYDYLSTESDLLPTEYALHQNYPNPFNPITTIKFDLPEASDVTIIIYNMLGQRIRTFNYQNVNPGFHSIRWDATNDIYRPVGAGVYLYQLISRDYVKTRKMVLLK